MAVEKFYAIYQHKDGTGEIVDVYQAIKLVYEDAVIVTKPKEKCSLFDVETYLKVLPRRGSNPHFRYYSDEESPLKGRKSELEYTPELKTFIRAFEEIKSFKIEEWEKNPITVFPKRMNKLQRIETKDSFVVLKFLVDLEETKPYSYYYKYNGVIALEFFVTSQPEPIKRKELGEKGIPLFLAKIKFPKWVSIPTEFQDEIEFENIANEIKETYQNRNYRLQGEFINQAVNSPEYKEKYIILNNFERQCEELREKQSQYEEKIKIQKEQLAKLKIEVEKQRSIFEEENLRLEEYRKEIVHYEKLKDANKNLTLENVNLKEDKVELTQKYNANDDKLQESLEREKQLIFDNSNYIKELEEMKNKGFLKKIFRKKSK